jgi:murein DD-endopeptidase MepM/ murein hydrolase activator NlpD
MSKNKSGGNMGAKGYYIALVLCAVAIGISGYFFFRDSQDDPAAQLQNEPSAAVSATDSRPSASTQPLQTQPAATRPTTPAKDTEQTMKTAAPVKGEVVAEYAMDCLSYNQTTRDWRVHNGVDYAAEAGTAVSAAADGEVYTVYEDDAMGMTVVIRHDGGYTTSYASLAENVAVKAGDQVKLGQTIGYVGSTALLESAVGDHVCFRVLKDDAPVDPAQFLS